MRSQQRWCGTAGRAGGQAFCASFPTGRIPIRSALSVVVVIGDGKRLKKETPAIAEFYKKNDYSTYYSGKWHLDDKPDFYPIEHGYDEMKNFAAYFPGVHLWSDRSAERYRPCATWSFDNGPLETTQLAVGTRQARGAFTTHAASGATGQGQKVA